jgi:hypothetical protein
MKVYAHAHTAADPDSHDRSKHPGKNGSGVQNDAEESKGDNTGITKRIPIEIKDSSHIS